MSDEGKYTVIHFAGGAWMVVKEEVDDVVRMVSDLGGPPLFELTDSVGDPVWVRGSAITCVGIGRTPRWALQSSRDKLS